MQPGERVVWAAARDLARRLAGRGRPAPSRVAEAAMQVMGRAGAHQVPDVKTALATGYGVYAWSDVMILSTEAS